ncbi:hypothetical protein BV898_03116 [Hypsibius exemplaris]|uniref:Uncharacterized protein n=1 Tax=Hypsibius exemplaris TaxID=2072580 RepID=A0A1W0X6R6_HYPEX|nr:hypothetical protein BV898_03116 [Hypsibius exemplaris]
MDFPLATIKLIPEEVLPDDNPYSPDISSPDDSKTFFPYNTNQKCEQELPSVLPASKTNGLNQQKEQLTGKSKEGSNTKQPSSNCGSASKTNELNQQKEQLTGKSTEGPHTKQPSSNCGNASTGKTSAEEQPAGPCTCCCVFIPFLCVCLCCGVCFCLEDIFCPNSKGHNFGCSCKGCRNSRKAAEDLKSTSLSTDGNSA